MRFGGAMLVLGSGLPPGAAVRRSPLLQRMGDAGRLGRKTDSGFYPYA